MLKSLKVIIKRCQAFPAAKTVVGWIHAVLFAYPSEQQDALPQISLIVTGHQILIGASHWGPRLELHVPNIIPTSRYKKAVQWLEKLVESSRGRSYIALSEKISNHDYYASTYTS